MRDNRIVESWNKVKPDKAADTRMLNAILTRSHELRKKQERRDTYLLCFTQIAMFIMTLSIIAVAFMFCPAIVRVLLIGYLVIGGLVSAVIALLCSVNNKVTKEGQFL